MYNGYHVSNHIQLYQQIDQAFPIFLMYVEKHGNRYEAAINLVINTLLTLYFVHDTNKKGAHTKLYIVRVHVHIIT